MPDKAHIIIGIITCARPVHLHALLDSLQAQVLAVEGAYHVEIIVVDNDTAQSAVVQEDYEGRYPVVCLKENKSGICHARNRVVDAVRDRADAIIFIDDDMLAPEGWLNALLQTWQHSQAEIVTAPFDAVLPEDAPRWAIKSRIFSDNREFETGDQIDLAYSCNLLISKVVFENIQPLFDPFFNSMGSSDIHMSLAARKLGYRIVWCKDAALQDHVMPSRVNFRWFVQRSYRIGNGDYFARMKTREGWRDVLLIVKLMLRRLVVGVGIFLRGVFTLDYQHIFAGMRMALQSAGMVAGMIGLRYREYKIVHGETRRIAR